MKKRGMAGRSMIFLVACVMILGTTFVGETGQDYAAETVMEQEQETDTETAREAEDGQELVLTLHVPEKANVYVDGTASVRIDILENGKIRDLREDERLVAEINEAVARADVAGQEIIFTGVQSGKTVMLLYLQRKNSEGEWKDVYSPDDSASDDADVKAGPEAGGEAPAENSAEAGTETVKEALPETSTEESESKAEDAVKTENASEEGKTAAGAAEKETAPRVRVEASISVYANDF